MTTKNMFKGIADDSDDDQTAVLKQKITKTQKKKEANKISEKTTTDEMAFFSATVGTGGAVGDFAETAKKQPRQERPRGGDAARGAPRGGRGGDRGGRGGDRGGRGGRGGRRVETDAEGNPVNPPARRERQPFRGKPREDAHPYDRKDGTGRAHRGDKKEGHGKGNWGGANDDKVYKKKGEETEERVEEETKEEAPAKKAAPKQEYVEEILGYSLDDFLKDKTVVGKKAERAAEGIKGAKV